MCSMCTWLCRYVTRRRYEFWPMLRVSLSLVTILTEACKLTVGGEPVRISSMVLLVAYAFYYRNVFSTVIYHHMPRERRCLRHSGAQQ
jgi:hypothetical protein